jgi:hypothetical protein
VSSGLAQLVSVTAPVTGIVDGVLGDADVLVGGILGPPDSSGAGAAPPASGSAPPDGVPAPPETGAAHDPQPSDAVAAPTAPAPAAVALRQTPTVLSTPPGGVTISVDNASPHQRAHEDYPPPHGPDPGPQTSDAGSGTRGGNGSPGGSAPAATQEGAVLGTPAGRLTDGPLDDRLPLVPTFGTDSAPD